MIEEIAERIKTNVQKTLEDKTAISFSGGIDSSLIAYLAKDKTELEAFSASLPGSFDYFGAIESSSLLGIKLNMIELSEEKIKQRYYELKEVFDLPFLKLELLVTPSFVLEEAKKRGYKVILYGSASEELFAGYERYYVAYQNGEDADKMMQQEFKELIRGDIKVFKKLSSYYGLEARFPFYDEKLAELVYSVPLEMRMEDKTLKKALLREVAEYLGLPKKIIKRKKKALQYGSGTHKILLKEQKRIDKKSH